MKVLVTGLFEPAALHSIRRFGPLGHEVDAAEGHLLAYAGFSKYVKRRVRLPNMRYFPKRYADRLLAELESGNYDAYFPSYEEIILMSHYRERIHAAVKTMLPDTATLMRLHDKAQLAELAREIGIATPEIIVPRSTEEAREAIASVALPVVVKMRKTSGAAGLRIVHDRNVLTKKYFEVVRINDLDEDNLPMLQQWIDGPTTCTLELCREGEVLGDVMYRGVRTMPRSGGTTVLRESVADPACTEAAARIVKYLDFHGFCGFDFVVEESTGKPYLVDGNCRITPAITMAYHGGCDMIDAWCRLVNGEEVASLPETAVGVRTKMQFADFVWLLESYFASFKDWSGEHRMRRAWWREKDHFYDIHSFSDPMPNIMVWVYILTNCYKLIFTDFDSAQLFIFHNQYTGDGEALSVGAATAD
ncbi:MAG: ATP-grasp domain-containing protein [Candidatus Bipolaricaulota bacterium]|nr:MAG: ATP-grasp domain-containing protein [Candidatus Bipolaricaulota bacterium]